MIKQSKIQSIEEFEYVGDVYNLELFSDTKDDDLFWCDATSGLLTHNCFPKDLNALISVARDVGVKPTVMSAIWEKNLELIPLEHRDWEKMQGRAVSKKPT